MILGSIKESSSDLRTALTPEVITQLKKLKIETIWTECGQGLAAGLPDSQYIDAGAELCEQAKILKESDLILSVNAPNAAQIQQTKAGAVWICAMNPYVNKDVITYFANQKTSSFALEFVPRTTRAQAMDIMSSQATVAGYKAVLCAANHLPRFFPMFMTAAGSIKPAKVLILGAGVAGLQAIATAKKLGAVVEAFDVRSAVKEEVQSLGAKFVEVDGATEDRSAGGYAVEQTDEYKHRQAKAIHDHAIKADVIITTAQIPGRPAPKLITKETITAMTPGAVIVDLAASTGGNCEGTVNNQIITMNGVKIIGNSSFPSEMPGDASKMFSRNILNLLKIMIDIDGNLVLNFDDDIIAASCITHGGEIRNDRVN